MTHPSRTMDPCQADIFLLPIYNHFMVEVIPCTPMSGRGGPQPACSCVHVQSCNHACVTVGALTQCMLGGPRRAVASLPNRWFWVLCLYRWCARFLV